MMQIPMLCHYIHTNKMHLSWESVAGVGFSDDTEQMCRDVIRDRGLFSLMHLIHVIVGVIPRVKPPGLITFNTMYTLYRTCFFFYQHINRSMYSLFKDLICSIVRAHSHLHVSGSELCSRFVLLQKSMPTILGPICAKEMHIDFHRFQE